MRIQNFFGSCLVLGLCAFLPRLAAGQSYTFTKVVDSNMQRPDGRGPFYINTVTTPAFDGQWVVFRDTGNADDNSIQAIWSYNTQDGTFHKLVDLHTAKPEGGTFTDLHLLDTAPSVRNGTVVFLGRDTSTGVFLEGLYSVPAAGGPLAKVVDWNTLTPNAAQFNLFDSSGKQVGGFSFDGATVAFRGQASDLTTGVYTAPPDGSSLNFIADNLHPYSSPNGTIYSYGTPVISGSYVVMAGTDFSDPPGSGYSGLYFALNGGDGTVTEVFNSTQPLPGDPNATFHTQFDAPVLALDGGLVLFRAHNSNPGPGGTPFFGLYWADLDPRPFSPIADVTSTLPGLGHLREIAEQGVAVSQGHVLFRAADDTPGDTGNNALFMVWAGTMSRIVGTGDTLDGKTVQAVYDPGPAALSGGAFVCNVRFPGLSQFALYVATPVSTNTAP